MPSPSLRRNQPLTDAINGTMPRDCVRDNKTPKNRKKCQTSEMRLNSSMLMRYRMAAASSIGLEPKRSPSQPVTGA